MMAIIRKFLSDILKEVAIDLVNQLIDFIIANIFLF